MPGNLSSYDALDIVRCFLLLTEQRSRFFLTQKLNMGEGSVRSILEVLKNMQLIEPSPKGHIQSSEGKALSKKFTSRLTLHNSRKSEKLLSLFFPLFPNDILIACELFEDHNLKDVYLLRDEAIRMGADGAFVMRYTNGKLDFPHFCYDGDLSPIENEFNFKKEGIIFLVIAKNESIAEKGILNMLCNLSNLFEDLVA